MNRKELVGAVATHTGMEPREVDKALRGTTEVIEAVAAKGEQVTISGFAKFARVDRPARMARNPATGAPVKVKASKKAKITPLKGFKDAVMSVSAAPKLAKGVWPPAAKAPGTAAPARKVSAASASKTASTNPPATSPTKRPVTNVARAPKTAAAAKTAVKKR
ncbi:MAG: HU family DNA-binding protein [Actinomycetota bacterium]|nr:HU family DNA-binding protein [Actinomycetota bacterium]